MFLNYFYFQVDFINYNVYVCKYCFEIFEIQISAGVPRNMKNLGNETYFRTFCYCEGT